MKPIGSQASKVTNGAKTREIIAIVRSQDSATGWLRDSKGRNARIYTRKLHVEDIDLSVHVVVADVV